VLGRDPRRDVAVTREIGLAPQQEALFEGHTALEFVELAALLAGLADPAAAAVAALAAVDLPAGDARRVATYSKGMRQRVKLAQALVGDPHVLVLDEPLTGLDPRQRLGMIDLLRRQADSGRCVVVSSHVLDEVERFGSRILVIAQGRLAAEGDFHAIRALMDDRPLRFRISVERAAELGGALLAHGLVVGARAVGPTTLEVETADAPALRAQLASACRWLGVRLSEFEPLDEDLESVFRYLVGGGR
jgi:ABC-2 type transport system ATP-binding protein